MKLSERKVLRRKEQILLSAISIINRKGYSGTTMEEVASELLMTKGSLYYYFKNKSDLMYQCHYFVLDQATKDLEIILEEGGPEKDVLRKMIETHITYAIDEKEIFNLIMEPKQLFNEEQLGLVLKLRNHYEGLFDEIIRRGIEAGEFHADEPKIARMIILGAMNWVQQWYRPDGRLAKEDLITIYSDYILKILE